MKFDVDLPSGGKVTVEFRQYHVARGARVGDGWLPIRPQNGDCIGDVLDRLRLTGTKTSLATECRIVDSDVAITTDRVILNSHDKPDKFVARKLALGKVLNALELVGCRKPARTAIWKAFLTATASHDWMTRVQAQIRIENKRLLSSMAARCPPVDKVGAHAAWRPSPKSEERGHV